MSVAIPRAATDVAGTTARRVRSVAAGAALVATLASAPAQVQVQVRTVPMSSGSPATQGTTGPTIKMMESPTLARFLRKAAGFTERGDYASAIGVLQQVLEGNTRPDDLAVGEGGAAPASQSTPEQPGEGSLSDETDPKLAVFSADDRLYRPVFRLCHEMLAQMPAEARQLYRQRFEVAAERALDRALQARDVTALEAVAHRWFLTHAAARAMEAASDLRMRQGRYRAALHLLRQLTELYPAEDLDQVPGITRPYLQLRVALCLARSGETKRARATLAESAQRFPDTTLRVAGELRPLASLADDLALGGAAQVHEADRELAVAPAVAGTLVPLWLFRYTDPDPYRGPREPTQRGIVIMGGDQGQQVAPRHDEHRPGTSVRWADDTILFLDHQRVIERETASGLVLARSEGADVPPAPRQGQSRLRVPDYDWMAGRIACDADRVYCVESPLASVPSGPLGPILSDEIAAYDRQTLQPRWRSSKFAAAYDGVTFLATPTVAGAMLLVPILHDGAYGLQAMTAATGAPLWRVPLHSGGSLFARAPAPPVLVEGGLAFVQTNAGAVAAVDIDTGALRWIRRYERTDPLHPTLREDQTPRTQAMMGQFFRELSVPGFVPSDPLLVDGRLILAPCDGDALLCLDGASGELLWVVPRPEVGGVADQDVYLLGQDGEHVFLAGDSTLMCVELRTGVRLWSVATPQEHWRGRGTVGSDLVLLPGDRCAWALPTTGEGSWRRIELPDFTLGIEPFQGPNNLFTRGPYLAVCYESGVELYGCADTLREMAQDAKDPRQQASLLVQAGDLQQAIDVLGAYVAQAPPADAAAESGRLLALTRDVALALASHGARDDALHLLTRAEPWAATRSQQLQLQLLRCDVFETLGEPESLEQARERLYAMMEHRQ